MIIKNKNHIFGAIMALSGAIFTFQAFASSSQSINWLYIPSIKDSVAYTIKNNKIAYVHPDTPDILLPKGLFYLQKKSDKKVQTPETERYPVFMIQNGHVYPG